MDLVDGNIKAGTPVLQCDFNGNKNQVWKIEPVYNLN